MEGPTWKGDSETERRQTFDVTDASVLNIRLPGIQIQTKSKDSNQQEKQREFQQEDIQHEEIQQEDIQHEEIQQDRSATNRCSLTETDKSRLLEYGLIVDENNRIATLESADGQLVQQFRPLVMQFIQKCPEGTCYPKKPRKDASTQTVERTIPPYPTTRNTEYSMGNQLLKHMSSYMDSDNSTDDEIVDRRINWSREKEVNKYEYNKINQLVGREDTLFI